MKKRKIIELGIFGLLLVATFAVVVFLSWQRLSEKANPQELGITYSIIFAEQLGLDAEETFLALLDEVQVKRWRIPVYWSLVEPESGQFDWSRYDWLLDQAERYDDVEITLVVGRKVPRWPECFIPDWVDRLPQDEQEQAVLVEVREVVEHFKDRTSVTRWQVENEPFLAFGECPHPSLELFQQEIALVRSLDDRPIQLTTSGEQEPWFDTAILGDVLGTSLYRLVYSDVFGFAFYPFGPQYYRLKAMAVSPLLDEVIISELQGEPWFFKPIEQMSIEEQYTAFDVEALQAHVKYAARTGLAETYLWGAEWWYYMKVNGDDRHWEAVKEIFSYD